MFRRLSGSMELLVTSALGRKLPPSSAVTTSLFSVVLLAIAADGCSAECQRTFESKTLSPNSEWIAMVHQEVCHPGITPYEVKLVDLVAAVNPKDATTLMSVEGQWRSPELVTVRWLSDHLLEVSVPNRTDLYRPLSSAKGIEIRVRYVRDNPDDRAAWQRFKKLNYEWVMNGGHGEQPKPPPLPPGEPSLD
jgi:hypothetical protein